MKEQLEILNSLAALIYEEAPKVCEEIVYKAELDLDEGWVESSFSYCKYGVRHSDFLSDSCEVEVSALVSKLNELMCQHTGGRWRCFVMKFDRDFEVSTDYEY